MKRLLLLALTLCIATISYSQDRFTDWSQFDGQELALDNVLMIDLQFDRVFNIMDKGKLRPFKMKDYYPEDTSIRLTHLETVTIKKSTYLRCRYNNQDIYLLIPKEQPAYISKFINLSYWIDKYNDISANTYICSSRTDTLNSANYSPISWVGKMYDTNKHHAIFQYKNEKGTIQSVTYDEFLHGKDLFCTESQYKQALQADTFYTYRDTLPCRAVCTTEYKYGSDEYERINIGDTVFIFNAVDGPVFYAKYEYPILHTSDYFRIIDDDQLKYIKEAGNRGLFTRFDYSVKYLNEFYLNKKARLQDRLDSLLLILDTQRKKYHDKQLFLGDFEVTTPKYGSGVGADISIYNCFSKTIKYVQFSFAAYNPVDDPQRDWSGKSTTTAEGIGPIEPDENAKYSFEDLFYDKNNVISSITITSVKFIFTDGTTKSFTGSKTVNAHCL